MQPIPERVLPGQEPPLSPTLGLEHLNRVTLALLPTVNQELLQGRDMGGHHRHRAILEVPVLAMVGLRPRSSSLAMEGYHLNNNNLDMEGHHHRSSRRVTEAQGHSKATLEVAQVTQERHHLSSIKAMVVPLSSNRCGPGILRCGLSFIFSFQFRSTLKSPDGFKQLTQTEVVR